MIAAQEWLARTAFAALPLSVPRRRTALMVNTVSTDAASWTAAPMVPALQMRSVLRMSFVDQTLRLAPSVWMMVSVLKDISVATGLAVLHAPREPTKSVGSSTRYCRSVPLMASVIRQAKPCLSAQWVRIVQRVSLVSTRFAAEHPRVTNDGVELRLGAVFNCETFAPAGSSEVAVNRS